MNGYMTWVRHFSFDWFGSISFLILNTNNFVIVALRYYKMIPLIYELRWKKSVTVHLHVFKNQDKIKENTLNRSRTSAIVSSNIKYEGIFLKISNSLWSMCYLTSVNWVFNTGQKKQYKAESRFAIKWDYQSNDETSLELLIIWKWSVSHPS